MGTSREHLDYLWRVSEGDDPPITRETATRAAIAWTEVLIATDGRMPVPVACTGPDGEMSYSWDCGRHHLDLEIGPGRDAEWFYRDRETEESWCTNAATDVALPPEVAAKLALFFRSDLMPAPGPPRAGRSAS